MSKLTKHIDEQIEELADMMSDDGIFCDDDYVFVVGPDGELKTVMIPDTAAFATPENVSKILTMYGVTDINSMCGNATLH